MVMLAEDRLARKRSAASAFAVGAVVDALNPERRYFVFETTMDQTILTVHAWPVSRQIPDAL
jgi:hypothetical protein